MIEASDKLPVAAIQAALTELRHGFDLNRKTLVALDDGGVNESVIDLMVALTYPKKFVVERASGGSAPIGVSTGSGWFDPFLSAEYAAPLMNCYTPYGYGYRSYYSMCGPGYYGSFGYNYYGYGYPYYPYYPGGGWVDIGVNPPIVGPPVTPQPEGRVVNGHGYTQIRDRQPEPAPRVNSSGNGGGGGQRRRRVIRRLLERVVGLRILGRIGRWRFGSARRRAERWRPVNHRWRFRVKAGNLPRPEGITALRPLIFSRRFRMSTGPLPIGSDAPDFQAQTTEGPINFHEWLGSSWGVMFSHPKDFTPVCTTELGYMAKIKPEFDKRGVKIIGLSIDPVDRHEGWAKDIAETQGTAPNYPMIGDIDLKVAKMYGMLPAGAGETCEGRTAADNATVRNVYVIGPDKKVKLVLSYPMSTGRNFDEVLRVLDSMQLTAKHKVATPVNWKDGQDVIILPAVSDDEAKQKYPQGWKAPKPYLRIVPQPK